MCMGNMGNMDNMGNFMIRTYNKLCMICNNYLDNSYIRFHNTYQLMMCYEKFKLYMLTSVIVSFQKQFSEINILNSLYFYKFVFVNTVQCMKLSEIYSKIELIDYYLIYNKDFDLFSMVLSLIFVNDLETSYELSNDILKHLKIKKKICFDFVNKRQIYTFTNNLVLINLIEKRLYELYQDYKFLIENTDYNNDLVLQCLDFLFLSCKDNRSLVLLEKINSVYKIMSRLKFNLKYCETSYDYVTRMYLIFNYNWIVYNMNMNTHLLYTDFMNVYQYLQNSGCFVIIEFKMPRHNYLTGEWIDTLINM